MKNTKIEIAISKASKTDFERLNGMAPVQIEECHGITGESAKKVCSVRTSDNQNICCTHYY